MEEDACEGLHNLSISEESTLAQCIQEKYSWLILQSKELVSKGNVQEALKLNQKAYRLCPSEKLQRKIQRMQAYVKENSNEIDHTESTDRSSVKSSRIERSSSSSSNNGGLSSDPSPKSSDPSPHSTGPSSLASPSQQALQSLSEEDQVQYAMLISEARQLVEKKDIPQALHLNRKALKILPSEKLQRKIQRMEMYIQQNNLSEVSQSSDENSDEKMSSLKSGSTTSVSTVDEKSGENSEEADSAKYARLISEAKELTSDGEVKAALDLYKEAAKICPSEKLTRKMERMEEYLRQNECTNENTVVSDSSKTEDNESIESTPLQEQTPASAETENQYSQLVSRAKDLTADGHVKEALSLYRLAADLQPSDKLSRKMERMEEYLRQSGIPIDDEDKKDMECEEPEPVCENEPPTQDKTPLTERAPPQDRIPPVDKAPPQDRIPSVDSTPLASRDRDVTSLSEEDQVQFLTLVSGAKEEMRQGRAAEALRSYKQAAQIYPSDKLQSKIQKLEAFLKESQTSNETSNVNHVNSPKRTPSRRPSGNNQSGSLSMDQQRKYNDLVMKAKTLATNGSIREALECNKKALAICFSEKLNKRIQKMESYLASNDDDEGEEGENGGMVPLGNGFYLFKDLMKNLYAHQKEGVLWMWGLHQKRKGGILGDDMGLGKTIQVISFLSGLFDMEKVHSVLIVMPVSVIGNWEKEFGKWAPGIKVESYHGSKKEKERSLAKIRRKGGVLLTSYGLVVTSWEMMSQQDGRPFRWDYLILDEGHKIKNPTKTTKGVHQIPAAHRILLTGTPIQNNLREMWSLFDFVHQGTLLGTARTFKMEYENPITRARERDATANERRLGMEMAESLKQIISPYFLRRTKAEVANKEEESEGDLNTSASRKTLKMPSMTRKNDFIIWLFLTPDQQRIYGDFLSLDSVKELLMTKKSPLVALTVLKKICDHPRLLSRRACAQLGLDGEHGLNDSALESEEGHQCAANQIKNMPDNVLIQESGKLIVIMDLLDQMKREGHRCLVFSQSRKMLDIIYQLINNRGHKVMRLDGTVTQLSERDKRIATFQEDLSYSVFLLTTQVGGVGLTLTAADRVIIYDPSWNPATDAQAVDRVFRIGQDKNVVIYRLITCGTVEEKIYRRQIFKDSITRQTTGNTKNPYRYFTKQELKELFTLDNPRISKTQQQLEEMHSQQRKTDSSLDAHIAFLYSLDIFGISDHDLMFTQEKCDFEDEGEAEVDPGTDYIQHRVQKAKELLQMESDLTQDFEQRSGKYPRNVPSEESGSQKPFSRPWGDWNLQGTVHSQEEGEEDVKDVQEVDIDAEGNSEEEEEDEEDDVQEVKRELETSHIDLVTPEPTPVKASAVVDLTASATKPTARIKLEPESPMSVIKREAEDQEEIQMEDVSPVPNLEKAEESEEEVQAIERIENLSIQASPTSTSKTNQSVTENEDLQSSSHEEVMQIGQQEELSDETENYDHSITEKSGSDKMEESIMVSEDEENKENVPLSQIIATAKRSSDSFKLNRSVDGQPRSPLAPIILSPVVTDSPAKKKPRRSVSQSPWLKHSPAKKDVKVVREEEVFISPDRFRPLMGTTSKGLQEKFKSRSNLNSTILSAFSDSPQSPYSSIRKETFNDSPLEGKRVTSRLQETLVEESPDRLGASAGLQTSFVPNSLDNTPNVSLSAKNISKDSSIAIGETDDESSPQKSLTVSKSDSVVESSILDEEEDEQVDDSDPLDDQSEVDIDSDDNDLPSLSVKKKKVRKAVIISDSESENNDENYEEEVEEAMDSVQKENRKKRKSSESNSLPQSKYAMLSSSDNEQSEDQEDMRSNEGSVDDEESIDIDVDSEDEDFQELPEELQDQYCLATRKAKELYKSCMYEECLVYVLQALEIYPENTALQAFALQVHSKKDQ
uniref:DNA excision repair protein ERCC-6-like isoform X3 n=1 Tax=Crassostrea virginica TaxID=6565 RepID=A0A8B8ETJ2_CRAVI|nr:DNA excision repair protein ERCC-6-like isoform X3 [Crassostrea virginica]